MPETRASASSTTTRSTRRGTGGVSTTTTGGGGGGSSSRATTGRNQPQQQQPVGKGKPKPTTATTAPPPVPQPPPSTTMTRRGTVTAPATRSTAVPSSSTSSRSVERRATATRTSAAAPATTTTVTTRATRGGGGGGDAAVGGAKGEGDRGRSRATTTTAASKQRSQQPQPSKSSSATTDRHLAEIPRIRPLPRVPATVGVASAPPKQPPTTMPTRSTATRSSSRSNNKANDNTNATTTVAATTTKKAEADAAKKPKEKDRKQPLKSSESQEPQQGAKDNNRGKVDKKKKAVPEPEPVESTPPKGNQMDVDEEQEQQQQVVAEVEAESADEQQPEQMETSDRSSGASGSSSLGSSTSSSQSQEEQQERKRRKDAVVANNPVVRLPRLTNKDIVNQQQQQKESDSSNKKKTKKKKTTTTDAAAAAPPSTQQDEPPQQNSYLPPPSELPRPTDSQEVQAEKLRKLKSTIIRPILSEVLSQVQDCLVAQDTVRLHRKVDRLYNFITEVYDHKKVGSEDGTVGQQQQTDKLLRQNTIALGRRYKNMVVSTIWGFGAVIWKIANNPFADKGRLFIQDCILRLGWKRDSGGGSRKKRKMLKLNGHEGVMGEWEDEYFHPACYFAINLFVKHQSDPNTFIRQHQLTLLQKLVQTASVSISATSPSRAMHFLNHVFEHASKSLLIRLKDKSSTCRALTMSTLSVLLIVPGADEELKKELKYFTRYDPSVEVRRIGTSAACGVERLKLRFFFDQAFDRNMGVRFEAFKAMGVEAPVPEAEGEGDEGEGKKSGTVRLIREMNQMTGDKLCKLVLWGALYSSEKCSTYVRTVLLRKWLQISCKNNLVRFLTNLDAFQHLVAVNKIMDMMFAHEGANIASNTDHDQQPQLPQNQRDFVESVDLTFITELKASIMGRKFRELSIESAVGWLGLCKASRKVGSLWGKVIPGSEEMGELIEGLHKCVFLENKDANGEGAATAATTEIEPERRDEEAGPVFCVVVGLEICRYVEWEEGGRLHMKKLIKAILLDPLMEERILLVQAVNILYKMFTNNTATAAGDTEFDELMMDVFQEVFDARNSYNRERRRKLKMMIMSNASIGAEDNVDGGDDACREEVGGDASSAASQGTGEQNDNGGGEQPGGIVGEVSSPSPSTSTASSLPAVTVAAPSPAQSSIVQMTLLNPYQMTRLKDEICELASQRLKLTLEKDALIRQKLFIEALPLSEKIMKLQDEETKLKIKLREQQEETVRRQKKAEEDRLRQVEEDKRITCNEEEGETGEEEMMIDPDNDVEPGDEEGEGGTQNSNNRKSVVTRDDGGVISTVEEGLTKGMLMINAYMDLRPKMNPFIRNLYENYASKFFTVDDLATRTCVLQFMARVAMIEKRELVTVTQVFIHCLVAGRVEAEICIMAYKCMVDLMVMYEWGDFIVRDDGSEGWAEFPYVKSFTSYLQKYLDNPSLTYETCTPEHMKCLFLEILTQKFPPPSSKSHTSENTDTMFVTKYQGLLKLLVRGRLRDPGIVSRILALWVNNDYCGTAVLKDLESVVKLCGTFEWWGLDVGSGGSVVQEEEGEDINLREDDDGDEEGEEPREPKKRDETMRVLGLAVGEAVILLCQEGAAARGGAVGGGAALANDDDDLGAGSSGSGENITKFVLYFLGFLDVGDQPLMRTIATTILSPVGQHPTRSYNTLLVRTASKIPITSFKSAQIIMKLISDIMDAMGGYPATTSVVSTRRELVTFVKKYRRVFGDEVVPQQDGDELEEGDGHTDDDEDGLLRRRRGRNNNIIALGDDVEAGEEDEGFGNDVVRFSSSDSEDEEDVDRVVSNNDSGER